MYKAHNKDLEAWESFDESEFEFIIRFYFPLLSTEKTHFDFHKKGKIVYQKIKIFPISDIDKRYTTKFFEVGEPSIFAKNSHP